MNCSITTSPEFTNELCEKLLREAEKLHGEGFLKEAAERYRILLAHFPQFSRTAYNLGLIMIELENYAAAEAAFRQALLHEPDLFEAELNLAFSLQEQGRISEAFSGYLKLVQLRPDSVEARFNLACLQLLLGNLNAGWADYELRFFTGTPTVRHHQEVPAWDGAAVPGLRLLVYTEQGYGDAIQMVRYLPLLMMNGMQVYLETTVPLASLLGGTPGLAGCIIRGEPLPPIDAQVPLMSLPGIFRTELHTIPPPLVLFPDSSLVSGFKSRMPDRSGFRAGICWTGRLDLPVNRKRSCPPDILKSLLATTGVSWVSLQAGQSAGEQLPDAEILDLADHLRDFACTAALISTLDLVVSIDTAVAHLAATMGVRTWLLLPHVPDWRWLLERDDSPWYPAMRIFRQPQPGAWREVVEKVRQALVQLCASEAAELTNRGARLDDEGRYEEAVACYLRALACCPDSAVTWYNYGNTLNNLGHKQAAIAAFLDALRHNPLLADAHHNLALLYREQGQMQHARDHLACSLRLRPDFADALHTRGEMLAAEERFDEAITIFRQLLEQHPERQATWNMLGITLQSAERDLEAVACYRTALRLDPDNLHARNNLGAALLTLGRVEESIGVLEQLLEKAPGYHDGHWNLAGALLAHGEWRRGWAEFEYRFAKHSPVQLPHVDLPLWDGADLGGQGILLQGEQAFGDTIQFIRFAASVAERGGVVHVACQHPALVSLVSSADNVATALSPAETYPASCVCRLPLMSLPHLLGMTLDRLPATVPYLHPKRELLDAWREKLPESGGLKIGICWSGRQTLRNRRRSCPPELLAPLADLPGVSLYSLQIGGVAPPAGLELIDLTGSIADFSDSAAFITCLDLVITIDTAVAHLAGALGKPVWLMLPDTVDWRWMVERADSPWYPTMRIFRQKEGCGWAGVLEEVVTQLQRIVAPRVYIYRPGIDFQEPPHLAQRLVPLLKSIDQVAEGCAMLPASNGDEADLLLFPYYLEHFTERATINGLWGFIGQLPFFGQREADHIFFSDHDTSVPYHTTSWWFRTSLNARLPDPHSIPLAYQTDDFPEYLHFDLSRFEYHASFVGYLGHRKQRMPLLAGLAREARMTVFIEATEAFYGHLTAEQRAERRKRYLEVSSRSLCILCPAGEGSNSIRFFEALALGRLPVLISDTPLPFEEILPYDRFMLRIAPDQAEYAGQLLLDWLKAMGDEELISRCREARTVWERWFSPQVLPRRLWDEFLRQYCRSGAMPPQVADPVCFDQQQEPLAAALPLLGAGKLSEAEPLIRQAVRRSPRSPQSYLLAGLLAVRQEHIADAEAAFVRAITYDHRCFDAYCELGRLFASTGRDSNAVERFYEASLIQPDNPAPYQEVIPCLVRLGREQEAMFCRSELVRISRAAIADATDMALDAVMALGDEFREQEQWDAALQQYLRVLQREPEQQQALLRAGGCLMFLNRHEEAVSYLRQAVRQLPEDPDPHVNLAICHLAAGRFREGWQEFEWRRRYITEEMPSIPELPVLAAGDRLDGVSILVHCEQGFGDMLQFCRYLPQLSGLGAMVTFSVPRELVRLFGALGAEIRIVAHGEQLPVTDYQALLMSLPRVMINHCPDIPDTVPYLFAPDGLLQAWRERLSNLPGLKIGLAWQGRNMKKSGYRRSLELQHLLPLLELADCSFVSLHPQQLASHPRIHQFSEEITDFADTAALMSQLDLVVTVDTAVAHLAGALGIACRVALLHAPDWRWFPLERKESSWYPTLQLFRQPKAGDWGSVVDRICESVQGEIYLRRGHALGTGGDLHGAIDAFQRATMLTEPSAAAWLNLGIYLHAAERTSEGISALKRAVELDPAWPEAWQNLGMLYQALRELPEAYSCFRRALLLRPGYRTAQWNLALLQLLMGEYAEGFRNFEARFGKTAAVGRLHQQLPAWDGSSPAGRTILLYAEQGYGDTIQFVRFLPLLTEAGGAVVLEVQDRSLAQLCRTIDGVEQVVVRDDELPPVDCQAPLLSLPNLLGSSFASIPRKVPYLSADKDKIAAWCARLPHTAGCRIGICWKGRATPDHRRSVPLDVLHVLWQMPGVSWVSLCFESAGNEHLPDNLLDFTGDISGFDDTAALISCLDMVISIDSAVAHLAGALGMPGYILLPFAADWRWGLTEKIAPWYPSLRLLRQNRQNDWDDVIETLVALLHGKAQE